MSGKYSAEWWKKFASIGQAVPKREPANIIDHLIQTTASGRASSPKKVESSPHTGELNFADCQH
jgi:hypothetical protein